jgi:acyl-CoA synthetase (AMP-forming)/AMP-acid ligase II
VSGIEPGRNERDRDARRALSEAPRAATLLEVLSAPAGQWGDLSALSVSPDGRSCASASWKMMWDGARGQGARLSAELSGGREPVLLVLPTSLAFFQAFFGTLAAGVVPVPVATPTTTNPSRLGWYQDLLAGIAHDAGATLLLTTERHASLLTSCLAVAAPQVRVLTVSEDVPRAEDGWQPVAAAPGDLALLQYTSGSTSRPKGVALTHANILANAELISEAIVTPESVGVSWLPLYHDMGLIGGALSAFYSRTPILLMPTTVFIKEPGSWLRAIGAFGGTITLAPNFAFQHAVRHAPLDQLEGVSLASLVTALNGAEPVDAAAVQAFEARFATLGLRPGTVRPVYGLAESSLAVTFADAGDLEVDEVDAEVLEQQGGAVPAAPDVRRRRFVSVGRPLRTQELRIVNDRDEPLAERQIGEVVVRGPSVMRGYYNRPEETERTLRGGWLHTGDLGYLAEGRLYLTGRSRDLIIRYGRNYYPADIEAAVGRAEGLGRGTAVAFAAGDLQEPRVVVVAETRLRAGADLAALDRQIRERCHEAFLFGPDDVRLVPVGGIPRTTSGKVRREECRRLYLAGDLPATGRPASETTGPL